MTDEREPDSADALDRLQLQIKTLDRAMQKLEELRKSPRMSKFESQRHLSYATACAEMSEYWAQKAITWIEEAIGEQSDPPRH